MRFSVSNAFWTNPLFLILCEVTFQWQLQTWQRPPRAPASKGDSASRCCSLCVQVSLVLPVVLERPLRALRHQPAVAHQSLRAFEDYHSIGVKGAGGRSVALIHAAVTDLPIQSSSLSKNAVGPTHPVICPQSVRSVLESPVEIKFDGRALSLAQS